MAEEEVLTRSHFIYNTWKVQYPDVITPKSNGNGQERQEQEQEHEQEMQTPLDLLLAGYSGNQQINTQSNSSLQIKNPDGPLAGPLAAQESSMFLKLAQLAKVDLQVRNLRPFKGKAEMPWTGWGDQAGVGIDEKGASNSANIRESRKARVTAEPGEGYTIILRYADGKRMGRRFEKTAFFQEVYDWAGSMEDVPLHFTIQSIKRVMNHTDALQGDAILDLNERVSSL
ncbi:hypothetical protein OS493_001864 [Desmophyllum pertusum]|uniref:UBX domain-containing protein n=1 Tax=Desmophyllum pertusum TaxID=174260 RepID=A0A9W9Z542_9CNID|nr:hypothetical protein OS493_001864 [Desmophyllum pertusum]